MARIYSVLTRSLARVSFLPPHPPTPPPGRRRKKKQDPPSIIIIITTLHANHPFLVSFVSQMRGHGPRGPCLCVCVYVALSLSSSSFANPPGTSILLGPV